MTTKKKSTYEEREAERANRDPITGTPGAHPVGVGVGATGGGAAGAAIGAVAGGPIGAAAGAAIGAVAGALAGKSTAEAIDPTVEDAYWRNAYKTRPYYVSGLVYDEYEPAYRYGYESVSRYPGKTWDETAAELESGWEKAKRKSSLGWDKAKHAARDAWERVTGKK